MKSQLFCAFLTLAVLNACSTKPSPVRQTASLDNNGEVQDDSFDRNLETRYGSSIESEQKSIDEVAQIIRTFIGSQKKVREEVANSNDNKSAGAQRVFGDLPKPSYATRDVHRKTNGCYKAELNIANDLMTKINNQIDAYGQESALAKNMLTPVVQESDLGVFTQGASYDAIVRLSNGHPGNRPDKLSDARGFAVKILPKGTLSSKTIAESNAADLNAITRLDILSINFPTFFVNDPVKYAKLNQAFLGSALDFKNKFAAKAEEFWSIFGAAGLTTLERRLALQVNGSVIYSPLYQEYFSMVPSRLGPEGAVRAVKYSWEPVSCSDEQATAFNQEKKTQWADWTKDRTYAFPPHTPSAVKKGNFQNDYLRANTVSRMEKGDFCFNFYVQVFRDSTSTNIEDSMDIWLSSPEEKAWWLKDVVPGKFIWKTGLSNEESRKDYLKRFEQKRLAPRILAGKLTMKQVTANDVQTASTNNKTCEDLSFNPWNGDIAHHKPLGIVSRMKRKVYNASRRERHELNGIHDKNIERP